MCFFVLYRDGNRSNPRETTVLPWGLLWLAAACHRMAHGNPIGHGAAKARAMVVPTSCAVGLAMAAHDSTMTRAMAMPPPQLKPHGLSW